MGRTRNNKFTKAEKSWILYDWANSAHSVIVVTILPIFFNSIATERGMSIWATPRAPPCSSWR